MEGIQQKVMKIRTPLVNLKSRVSVDSYSISMKMNNLRTKLEEREIINRKKILVQGLLTVERALKKVEEILESLEKPKVLESFHDFRFLCLMCLALYKRL